MNRAHRNKGLVRGQRRVVDAAARQSEVSRLAAAAQGGGLAAALADGRAPGHRASGQGGLLAAALADGRVIGHRAGALGGGLAAALADGRALGHRAGAQGGGLAELLAASRAPGHGAGSQSGLAAAAKGWKEPPRHKVFVSYHHANDQRYKDLFVQMMGNDIVDRSVRDGDIDDTGMNTDRIRQRIRDEFIRDATVTVVLVGTCTWQRKHVDWEIGSSLRDTKLNSRCGLLGIVLPSHPMGMWNLHVVPPRLADNCKGFLSFAAPHQWSSDSRLVRQWIHDAYEQRSRKVPDNSRDQFRNNRSGDCAKGWQD